MLCNKTKKALSYQEECELLQKKKNTIKSKYYTYLVCLLNWVPNWADSAGYLIVYKVESKADVVVNTVGSLDHTGE